MEPILGQIAALSAAVCWSICTPCFTLAGRRIGSLAVNIHRLVIAGIILSIYGLVTRGLPFPTDAAPRLYYWLSASGLVGFFLCDLCLFRSFLLIGPRLAMLILAMAPPLAAMIDWGFRGIPLSPMGILGMAITLTGVAWVVLERRLPEPQSGGQNSHDNNQKTSDSQRKLGLALASFATFCQAMGMVFADIGLSSQNVGAEGYNAFAANQIRLFAGLSAFLVMITITKQWKPVLSGLKNRLAMAWLLLGAITGPFLGVSFALLSLNHIPTGMAMTLMAMPPVFILPVARFLLQEQISARAIFGAIIAVSGVAILFLT